MAVALGEKGIGAEAQGLGEAMGDAVGHTLGRMVDAEIDEWSGHSTLPFGLAASGHRLDGAQLRSGGAIRNRGFYLVTASWRKRDAAVKARGNSVMESKRDDPAGLPCRRSW
jgi:hypothetical protein